MKSPRVTAGVSRRSSGLPKMAGEIADQDRRVIDALEMRRPARRGHGAGDKLRQAGQLLALAGCNIVGFECVVVIRHRQNRKNRAQRAMFSSVASAAAT